MACVERETAEETGLVVRGVKIVGTTNDLFTEANKHYITLFAKCVRVDPQQQPQVRND
jgi:8-oxo-dGTP diphosphatase